MNDKPFKTHEELLSLLESRGIIYKNQDSRSFAKKKLQRIGYYNLINGYSSLFWDTNNIDHYKKGTTIEEIYSLYVFDSKLREVLLKNILPLETNIKSLVAYYFPQNHPESHYLVYENFDTTRKDSDKNILNLLSEIHRQIASRISDPSIAHYIQKYGYVPLWVLNNVLTLGTISKFYSLMQQPERQSISRTFHLQDSELISILTYISSIRNFCAHGNRLYCFRNKRPLCNTSCHISMGIPMSDKNEYMYGKRDLYAAIIALKLTLSKNEFRRLVKDIDIALKNLDARTQVLLNSDILCSMGFPANWKEQLLSQ